MIFIICGNLKANTRLPAFVLLVFLINISTYLLEMLYFRHFKVTTKFTLQSEKIFKLKIKTFFKFSIINHCSQLYFFAKIISV